MWATETKPDVVRMGEWRSMFLEGQTALFYTAQLPASGWKDVLLIQINSISIPPKNT